MSGSPESPTRPQQDPATAGPLDHATAIALIERADGLVAIGEYAHAAPLYSRVVGHASPDLHVSALLGLAECHFRLDNEPAAEQAWELATRAPDTPISWVAWKQLAGARVRSGDLRGAREAYQRAERVAPPEAHAEIASRLGWLNKELGNQRAASRYFGRARAGGATVPVVTYAILAITIGISVAAFPTSPQGVQLFTTLGLDKAAVANGQYWRLLTVTLVHEGWLHLATNMYALFLVGPLVERIYGRVTYLAMYLLCAAAASVASFVFVREDSVGASGAIFGLFGILFIAFRLHHPAIGRNARSLAGQIGFLIVLNLVLGLGLTGTGIAQIDNFAHVGGLLAGFWLGFFFMPTGVPTVASLWQRPAGTGASRGPGSIVAGAGGSAVPLARVGAVGVLFVVIALGLVIGTQEWHGVAVAPAMARAPGVAVAPLKARTRNPVVPAAVAAGTVPSDVPPAVYEVQLRSSAG